METKLIIIDSFVGGIVSDPRTTDLRYSQLLKNFDAHSYEKKLVPFRDAEDGDSAGTTSKKQNFCVALRTGTTYAIFALGVKSGTTLAEILYKDITTDFDDNVWNAPTNNNHQSATGTATNFNLFVYYRKVNSGKGLIYGARDGTNIWAFSPGDNTAFADTSRALVYTNIAQGLVHSKDDILYIPYDNKIAKNDNGSWTDAALTLPTHYKINSICEYGNFLAIAVAPLSGVGNSKVYLWDRDSSLTTVSDSIDWGEGSLTILEEIEGYLIGISYVTTATIPSKIVFRQYSGGIPTVFNQLFDDTGATTILIAKQKVNQYLYFLLAITLKGAEQRGLWKIGRNSPSSPFSVAIDRGVSNDTASLTTYGFIIVGDYVFIAYTAAGTYDVSKTNDTASYTATSIYESLIINLGDSSKKKKLIGITVMTEELPYLGQVVLKYKKDEDIDGTTWTTIFTHSPTTAGAFIVGRIYKITSAGTTDFTLIGAANSTAGTVFTATGVGTGTGTAIDNLISHSAVNSLPEFKEIVFRIESTGGSIVTGLKFKVDLLEKDIY